MYTSPEYDLLEVPGSDNLTIAVISAMHHGEQGEDTGARLCEWTIIMDLMFPPLMSIQLYGWYAESERETGPDVGNQLFTSSSLKHSELVVVIPCGMHLATLECRLAAGKEVSKVIIMRNIKTGGPLPIDLPIQTIIFGHCYITKVQQYLDYIIVSLKIGTKMVICTAFDQEGMPSGVGVYDVSFVVGDIDTSLTSLLSML
ncbi:MAG: hypothetical protein LBR89_00850 [Holosporales bacterium]|jgi:hypothetical protein|nr:hypothetical protein [Holosporales bacterium]